jgi:hypothetical protein
MTEILERLIRSASDLEFTAIYQELREHPGWPRLETHWNESYGVDVPATIDEMAPLGGSITVAYALHVALKKNFQVPISRILRFGYVTAELADHMTQAMIAIDHQFDTLPVEHQS